ncbi:MAG TPA: dihydroneopterin aldolase [Phaeodactylibacter sp.]|nr:dihydroneopterin aldolase [Phaeodactylibacter sp.]
MGQIALEGLKFYAYHGVYKEEELMGNHFEVDIYIMTDFEEAAKSDDVYQTINYETVYLICQSAMRKRVKLIETLSLNIMNGLKRQYNNIEEMTVRIRKSSPIPYAKSSSVYVEETQEFVKSCPKCNKPFICYSDEHCWCHGLTIRSTTRAVLAEQYKSCLCGNCLKEYADVIS